MGGRRKKERCFAAVRSIHAPCPSPLSHATQRWLLPFIRPWRLKAEKEENNLMTPKCEKASSKKHHLFCRDGGICPSAPPKSTYRILLRGGLPYFFTALDMPRGISFCSSFPRSFSRRRTGNDLSQKKREWNVCMTEGEGKVYEKSLRVLLVPPRSSLISLAVKGGRRRRRRGGLTLPPTTLQVKKVARETGGKSTVINNIFSSMQFSSTGGGDGGGRRKERRGGGGKNIPKQGRQKTEILKNSVYKATSDFCWGE